MEPEKISVRCSVCNYLNRISTKTFYDGYEGNFLCSNCGSPLDKLEVLLEE